MPPSSSPFRPSRRWPLGLALSLALGLALGVACPVAATAAAATPAPACPQPGTLGTARVLSVDPARWPRVGTKSFPDTLPLADKEVVLTFDDGPAPPTTTRILAALARECVRATFFLIGRSAAAHRDLVRAMAAAGHTIGHHSWSHPDLGKLPDAAARSEIERGIAADDAALGLPAGTAPATPFFRFPYFSSTPALLDLLEQRGIAVFGADLWASDWNEMTPEQELALITGRLAQARKGIILFHDTKARTAAIMPQFLRYLRDNGYRVVHLEPARPRP
jgi:peptidoglycan/xylan/chitin deacetylase (PgdA/CDA1 family)